MNEGPARVLVVDDDEGFHDCVQHHLHQYELSSAYNGLQMFKVLDHEPIDVVLLDLELPGPNGLELLPALKTRQIPTIVVSAHCGTSNVVRSVQAGAFDVIDKSHENYLKLDSRVEAALAHSDWERGGRDPICIAKLEGLMLELAALGADCTPPSSASCYDELSRMASGLLNRDHRARAKASPYQLLQDHFRSLIIRFVLFRCRGNRRQASAALGA